MGVPSKHWARLEPHPRAAKEKFLTDSQLPCPGSLPKAQTPSVVRSGQVLKPPVDSRCIQGKRFGDSTHTYGTYHPILCLP